METVTLTIDGRQVTVEKGKTVLQAAIESGIPVPYYCYHPGIGVEGSCRVCIVKIEKTPKLQTSCSTLCADGMVVVTRDPDVDAARAGVFEFLLVNHPLDCPVCDKGGECPLQDFSYSFGPDGSRMEFPRRVFDGEGVSGDVDFGPTLMLNRQRCIMCTRCKRFMSDVDGDAQINVIDRGYGSEIGTFQEEGVHSILSGNLMDVCPVGAITTRDYRFKSRPWDNPNVADTICTDCSKGCNTSLWLKAKPEWAKGSSVVRVTPRFNPDVNGYWMCDIGRFGYHWIEGNDRLRRPMMRSGGALQPASWHELMPVLRDRWTAAHTTRREGIRFLLSAHASHEEFFLFRRLAEELLGPAGPAAISVTWRTTQKIQPAATQFKVPSVDAPNVNGARLFGLAPGHCGDPQGAADIAALRGALSAGQVAALYVYDPGSPGSLGDVQWIIDGRTSGLLPLLVVQGVVMTELAGAADFVLPGAASAEKRASYTNDQGRLQGSERILHTPGEAVEDWRLIVDVAAVLGLTFEYESAEQVRADIAARYAGSPGLDGLPELFLRPPAPRTWLQTSNPSERWKWDIMYQDLPPVKGAVDRSALPAAPSVIPLREVR
jgi:NADH-quinone oxidoreductase subunit G